MEFSGIAPPDTSDITSNTKFTAHFKRPFFYFFFYTQNQTGDRERNLGRKVRILRAPCNGGAFSRAVGNRSPFGSR